MTKERKGPSESATQFSIGTKKLGNNGNMWEIIKTKKGVHRWQKVKNTKKNNNNKNNKNKKKNKKEEYYLIHNNGSRSFVVVLKNNRLNVYKTIWDESIYEEIDPKKLLKFDDYTDSNPKKDKIVVDKKPVFVLPKFKKIFIGNDVNSKNTYIKNKDFGKGNSILVFDGKEYYVIFRNTISKLNTKKIKGEVIGYFSEISNNDVPYPIMFTKTHIYSWCDGISEFPIEDEKTMKILLLLNKIENPFQIKSSPKKEINNFFDKYACEDSKILLDEKILVTGF